jgi:hypothetical protein
MCDLTNLIRAAFDLDAGVTFMLNSEGEVVCTVHGIPTPRGCIDFIRYGHTLEAALTSALDHAGALARNPDLAPPATDLLTLLGLQPAAKPKPNFTGTIRRI